MTRRGAVITALMTIPAMYRASAQRVSVGTTVEVPLDTWLSVEIPLRDTPLMVLGRPCPDAPGLWCANPPPPPYKYALTVTFGGRTVRLTPDQVMDALEGK